MKWDSGHRSENVEDRRSERGPGAGAGMLGPLLGIGARFGIPGIVVALALFFGAQYFLSGGEDAAPAADSTVTAQDDELARFSGFVLDDAQRTWSESLGSRYQPATLVLFTGSVSSACGLGQAAMGPFYCPRDERVFLDLSFFEELRRRFGAAGDFAQAYVIAHELGHHVQHQLGLLEGGQRGAGADGQSVRTELQADCLAGVWASSAARRDLLEPGDMEEALRAASAIGDDRLQRRAEGRVQPETWTHGSSAQRATWFRRGFEQATIEACDTSRGAL